MSYKYKYTRGTIPKFNKDGTPSLDENGVLLYETYVTNEYESLSALRKANTGLILSASPTDEQLLAAGIEKIPTGDKQVSLLERRDAVLKKLDVIILLKARKYGYTDIVSAASYKDSHIEKFRIEGTALSQWRDETYAIALSYFDDVVAGRAKLPETDAEILALLPKLSLEEE